MVSIESILIKRTPPSNNKILVFLFSIRELNLIFLCRVVPGYVPRVYVRYRGFNSIEIIWAPILEENSHGVLLGYVVYFKRHRSYEIFTTVKVNASTHVLRITGLSEATKYEIKVAGRTSVGEGPLRTTYQSTG